MLESSLAISDGSPRLPRSACSGEPSSSRSASSLLLRRDRHRRPRGSRRARARGTPGDRELRRRASGPDGLPDAGAPPGRRRSAPSAQRLLESRGSTGKGCATALVDAPSRRRGPGDGLRRLTAELAAAGSKRVVAAGGSAVTAVESQARTVRRDFADSRGKSEATRLNEQAAACARKERSSRRWRSVSRRSRSSARSGTGVVRR